jgi:hypothetical protein
MLTQKGWDITGLSNNQTTDSGQTSFI